MHSHGEESHISILYSYATFYALNQIFFTLSKLFDVIIQVFYVKRDLTNEHVGQKLYKTGIMATILSSLSQAVSVRSITVYTLIV